MGGVTLAAMVLGQLFLPQLLAVIQTPAELMGDAALYLRVILGGMVFTFTYNYLASTLRAVGDTKRPLYFLLAAGIVNVLLNLFFVIVLSMGVAGVALATVISQCISAYLIVRCLMKTDAGYSQLNFGKPPVYGRCTDDSHPAGPAGPWGNLL